MGGVILAYEMARAVGARAMYAEKVDGAFELRRGFTVSPKETCLVVEDAVTTGGSARKLIEAMEAGGARVVGVAALVDRSGGAVDFGLPFTALVRMDIPSYAPEECPLCLEGVPLVRPKSSSAGA
jgi:orotate phosphoribosyltransferase